VNEVLQVFEASNKGNDALFLRLLVDKVTLKDHLQFAEEGALLDRLWREEALVQLTHEVGDVPLEVL